jgi:hypothetical protein
VDAPRILPWALLVHRRAVDPSSGPRLCSLLWNRLPVGVVISRILAQNCLAAAASGRNGRQAGEAWDQLTSLAALVCPWRDRSAPSVNNKSTVESTNPLTQNYLEPCYLGVKPSVEDLSSEEVAKLSGSFFAWPVDKHSTN